jgi:hypothetical protein
MHSCLCVKGIYGCLYGNSFTNFQASKPRGALELNPLGVAPLDPLVGWRGTSGRGTYEPILYSEACFSREATF